MSDQQPLFWKPNLKQLPEIKESKTYSFPVASSPYADVIAQAYIKGAVAPGNPCQHCISNNTQHKGFMRTHFHGSELNACARAVFYKCLAMGGIEDVRGNEAFLLDGHTHEMLTLKCIARGLTATHPTAQVVRARNQSELVYETTKNNNRIKIVGHQDGILIIDNQEYILECKAVKQYTWDELLKGKISPIWYGQMQFYMLATGIHKAILLVKNRITSNLHPPLVFEFNPEFVDNRLAVLANVKQSLFGTVQQVPNREHKKRTDSECKFCPFAEMCWEDSE
jgi:hypothetical protein